jgi:hypothetical protein
MTSLFVRPAQAAMRPSAASNGNILKVFVIRHLLIKSVVGEQWTVISDTGEGTVY